MLELIGLSVVLILSKSVWAQVDSDFDPASLVLAQDVVDAVFPRTCALGESWKNEQSTGKSVQCIFQRGHWAEELAQFANDAESLGCSVDKTMAKYMADNFGSPSYVNNPIYKRLGEDCGVCGLKASCCGVQNAVDVVKRLSKDHPEVEGVNPFYFQSIKGLQCSEKSTQVCSMDPLTPLEFDTLAKMQNFTKNIDRTDDCNFAQFGYSEWESSRTNLAFPLVASLYNKFLKNSVTNKCMCCCHSYFPQQSGSDWTCVPRTDQPSESICATA